MKHSLASPMAIRQRATAFGEPVAIRRGSVSERFMTCGKHACPCHESREAKHGPYFSLTRQVHGSTRSRYLSAEQAARAQEQIQAGREFRDAVELFWEACEKRADAELFTPDASDGPEAERGGSTRRLAPKPKGKSRR